MKEIPKMNSNDIMTALGNPFPASDVEWRIQVTNGEKTSGLAVPYIDSRAIQNRLDAVVGTFNWQNTFIPWQNNAQLCGISLYCEERKEWITKYDGSPNSDIEAVKGGLSDACKRAAVQWGVGRYLYGMDGVWVDIEKRGSSYVIKRDQQKKLDDAYAKMVAQLTGKAPAPAKKPADNSKPAKPPVGSGDNISRFPELYTVTSAKTSNNGNNVSMALSLTDPQGKPIQAYLRGNNPDIKSGVKMKDLTLTEKTGTHGTYFVVDKYEIAA
jgi:hypothetical protein